MSHTTKPNNNLSTITYLPLAIGKVVQKTKGLTSVQTTVLLLFASRHSSTTVSCYI